MKTVSVVVSTIPERRSLLTNLLKSLSKQTMPPDEVIIVSDGYSNLLKGLVRTPLKVRFLDCSGGLSSARNKGVTASLGDIVVFIDDDVIIPDETLLYKVRIAFEENPRLGAYGVSVRPLVFNSPVLPDGFNWLYGCTDSFSVRPVGAFFAVRRELFNVVGLFDERLGRNKNLMSGEETELFQRISKLGLEVVLDKSNYVYHIICSRGIKYLIKRAFYEGISKAKFSDLSVEKIYLRKYLKTPLGWFVLSITGVGYLVGRCGFV